MVNRNLERLSTRPDYDTISLEDAASSARECSEIQNRGAVLKHGFRRRLGILIGDIEEKEGVKARKKVAADLKIPFVELKKSVNEAAVPKEDYDRYIEGTLKRGKEITDAGALRAGKKINHSRRLSAAASVVQKLSLWINSSLIKSLLRDYAGSQEELNEAATILDTLSSQFASAAKEIRK